jgi:RimJ/RimL family protein N-acetyltransferase
METVYNHLGQPLGAPLPNWVAPPFPTHESMLGRICRLEPLSWETHGSELYEAFTIDKEDRMWTYLPVGPFSSKQEFGAWVDEVSEKTDPQFYAIIDMNAGKAVGIGSLMRIAPGYGCIEVGFLAFSPLLQRTTAATEAMYLMMRRIFELGYRRYEWKCNALNLPSRIAAERLGFTFEGIFRQAVVVKGRNRDTAWYSIIDSEWPAIKTSFEQWLDPANFDINGHQIKKLDCGHRSVEPTSIDVSLSPNPPLPMSLPLAREVLSNVER